MGVAKTMRVYFLRCTGTGLIKIGAAQDVAGRLATLQIGSASRLEWLADFSAYAEVEHLIHERFKALRVQGEWFKPGEELVRFIGDRGWEQMDIEKWRPRPFEGSCVRDQLRAAIRDDGRSIPEIAAQAWIDPRVIRRLLAPRPKITLQMAEQIASALGLVIVLERRRDRGPDAEALEARKQEARRIADEKVAEAIARRRALE